MPPAWWRRSVRKRFCLNPVMKFSMPGPSLVPALTASFNNTDAYWAIMSQVIRPEGKIVSIVENEKPLDLNTLKAKSATFAWEFMFTRSMFQTHDIQQQHELLNRAASLIDAGKLRPTLTETLTPINASNLRAAHARLESGRMIGKLALVGW